MAREIENNELNLMLSVVKKYYEMGLNQEQIAKEEFISKSSVCRLIKKAVTNGYVRFQINYPVESVKPLEDEIKSHFKLDKVFITPSYTDDPDIRMKDTCRSVAHDLCKIVQPDDIICVSWGRTLDALANIILGEMSTNKKCSKIVMMNGSMAGDIDSTKSSRIVERFAEFFAAEGYLLPVPLIVDSKYTADCIKADSHVKYVLDFAVASQLAVFSVGAVNERSVLRQRGAYSEKDFELIASQNAVGDIDGHCFDINGSIVSKQVDDRLISLALENIKSKRTRIGIAVGEEKAPAIIGAMRGNLVNRLFTDELTAHEVVKLLRS